MGDDHPDLGSDSIGELPVRKWCHVVFTFTNRTAASLAAGTSSHDKDDDDQDMLAHPWGYGERMWSWGYGERIRSWVYGVICPIVFSVYLLCLTSHPFSSSS
jgi:hypothetical protein